MGTLVRGQKFVPKKKCSLKKKVFTSNLSRISWYGLLYPVYMFEKFCHIVAEPLCTHHGRHFDKLWFWLCSKINQPSLAVKRYNKFLYFYLQSYEIKISSSLFPFGENMKSGVY